MPAISQGRRELSPLDEEPRSKMEHPFSILKCDSAHSSTASTHDPETFSILQSLAGVILTSTYTGRRSTIGNSGDRIALTSKHSSKSGQHFKVVETLIMRGSPICIEVNGMPKVRSQDLHDEEDGLMDLGEEDCLLIEKWVLQIINLKGSISLSTVTTLPFLTQAIRSFLHFSQISSWAISCGGNLPFDLIFRVSPLSSEIPNNTSSFPLCPPETHTFPLVPLLTLPQSYLRVSVTYLPRLEQIPPKLLSHDMSHDTNEINEKDDDSIKCDEEACFLSEIPISKLEHVCNSHKCTCSIHVDETQVRVHIDAYEDSRLDNTVNTKGATCKIYSDSYGTRSSDVSNCTYTSNDIVSDNQLSTSEHVNETESKIYDHTRILHKQTQVTLNRSDISFPQTSIRKIESTNTAGFPFSPPQPSPLSPKLLPCFDDHVGHSPRDRVKNSEISGDEMAFGQFSNGSSMVGYNPTNNNPNELYHTSGIESRPNVPVASKSGISRKVISRLVPHQTNNLKPKSSSSSPSSNYSSLPPSARKTHVSSSIGSINGWKGGVRPPGASSPIPFFVRPGRHNSVDGSSTANETGIDVKDLKRLKRRSCGINIKNPVHIPHTRSMSLPTVVPNLCLLGTFEESVLNGRIDPYGYVEGFTAELGASGSFCPQHVNLPVTASYFSLSDDGGPSPYLGQINLSGVGKRGYHVPKKGTVQLTLFNPNKTVVKIFIVTYNHSDMPPNTTTFIRQKTLSKPLHVTSTDNTLPSLHYLIHLRFLCSKSSRIYLHTHIKLIFARRAPDTDPDLSKVSLYTINEGPSNPKYGPLNNEKL